MASKWALLVGVSEYSFMSDLRFAPRDAETVAQRLIDDWEYPQANVVVMSDLAEDAALKPGRGMIGNQLERLKERGLGADDELFFFFSGHGLAKGRKDYLVPADCNPGRVDQDGIAIASLVDDLQSTGSRRIFMFIDACRNELSPPDAGAKGPDNTEFMGVEADSLLTGRDPVIAAFFSCNPQKRSFEIARDIQAGAFTHALLAAMADDSKVETLSQLKQHFEALVPTLTTRHGFESQQPYLITAKGVDPTNVRLFSRALSDESTELINRINAAWEDEDSQLRLDESDGVDVYAIGVELAAERLVRLTGPKRAARNLLHEFCEGRLVYDEFKPRFLKLYRAGQSAAPTLRPRGRGPGGGAS